MESKEMEGPWGGHEDDIQIEDTNTAKPSAADEILGNYTLYLNNTHRYPSLLNVTGNHDVGYKVPDIQPQLIQQFIK
jgi:hypothetical protein